MTHQTNHLADPSFDDLADTDPPLTMGCMALYALVLVATLVASVLQPWGFAPH